MELQRVGHNWATKHNIHIHTCASSGNHSKLQILIQSVWDGAWGSSHSGTLKCWRIHHPKLHFESQHPAVTSLQREVGDQDEGLTGRRQWSASAFGKGSESDFAGGWVTNCLQSRGWESVLSGETRGGGPGAEELGFSWTNFLFLINFYWSMVVLQCCVSCCSGAKWNRHTNTKIPSVLDFLPT